MHRIFDMPVSRVYPLYVAKLERKRGTADGLDAVTMWLTGFDEKELHRRIDEGETFREFFEAANFNDNAELITGSICGVKIQDIEDPLMKKIRCLDKLVDELAQGRPMEKILRTAN